MPDYLKEAFFFRWNLLFFFGAAAAAALTPLAPVLLPLVAAGEVTYLTGLVSVPRFRAAIDAKVHAAGRAATAGGGAAQPPAVSLVTGRARASNSCTRAAARCAASPRAFAAPPAIRETARKTSAPRGSIGSCGCFSDCSFRKPRSTVFCRR
jgi:hypothetical protein